MTLCHLLNWLHILLPKYTHWAILHRALSNILVKIQFGLLRKFYQSKVVLA